MTSPRAVTAVAEYLAWALSEGRLGNPSSPADATHGSGPDTRTQARRSLPAAVAAPRGGLAPQAPTVAPLTTQEA